MSVKALQQRDVPCLMVASIFTPIQGGSATVYANLCRHAPDGSMVALATRRHYESGEEIPGWREHDLRCGFPVYRVDLLRPQVMPPPANKLVSLWRHLTIDIPLKFQIVSQVWSLIRKHDIRVICIGELASMAWLALLFRRLLGTRMVLYVHGEEITQRLNLGSFGRRRAAHLKAADAVVAVSRFTEQALVEQMGVSRDKICLIENGVDTQRFSPGPDDPELRERFGLVGRKLVVTVGRLVPRKGFDKTIAAWSGVCAEHPDAHLLIVGDGPQRAELQAMADASGVADRITFAGSVDDATLLAAYRSASLFVMPNRTMPDGDTEGFGLVFLEANACGRAVVGGRAGGAVEAVSDGVSGLLVDGENVDEIGRAIGRILGDDAFRSLLEEGALRHAQANSWGRRVTIFQNLCRSLQKGEKNV
ncbi:glycosyltransferase family 4 protein [Zoogloea sp.]|uniref:glycosyltransferase family 4 protein n=1 Tax=Zoogloea sp. TaxID=49181 RepID=UPI0026020F5F|nr:glycosyltransferase family 4 protein [Zoogloea sp.]MDD3352547.1 glycosyltransferase family 4 protein [Zoogloea sp.]